MVGHSAETGQVVAVDFRQGNVPPAQDNLTFIKQCQQSLPEGCAAMRAQIVATSDTDWQPLIDKQGKIVKGQDTYRTSFCIGGYEKAFTLVIQRKALSAPRTARTASRN